jgi:hypothetical protein
MRGYVRFTHFTPGYYLGRLPRLYGISALYWFFCNFSRLSGVKALFCQLSFAVCSMPTLSVKILKFISSRKFSVKSNQNKEQRTTDN